jgi:two-component system response regulator
MKTLLEIEILLIEDNMDDAALTIRALKKNNVINNILHVEDGAQALDFIFSEGAYADRAETTTPKLILLDIKMPKINGLQVLRRLKSDERTKNIPVVMLTSSKEDPDIKKCYELGVNSYIIKPVDFENFQSAISKLAVYWLLINEPPR